MMTGRIVDSYTNIQTIKLFAHTLARARLRPRRDATSSLATVYRQMRLITASSTVVAACQRLCSSPAIAGTRDLCSGSRTSLSLGAIAVAIGLVMRIARHVAVDPVGGRPASSRISARCRTA